MSAAEHRTATRILVVSDTHAALLNSKLSNPFSKPLPVADVAIHCGDLTITGKLSEHERALALLKSLPAPLKIVIPGNHDLTLDPEFCSSHKDREFHGILESRNHIADAHDLYTNDAARKAGIIYLTEGIRTFQLANGAILTIYASAYTPEFCDWAFAYPREIDRFNAENNISPENPVPDHSQSEAPVSIMITHGPPYGILDATSRGEHVGCEHLRKAVERCRPQLHCFGHIHEAWGAIGQRWSGPSAGHKMLISELEEAEKVEQGLEQVGHIDGTSLSGHEETIFVNASIMDLGYDPSQKPWVIDLLLPSSNRKPPQQF